MSQVAPFHTTDRLKNFCRNLLQVWKKFIDTPFEKRWLLHDDLIAEASTFLRLGSTRQYTNFQISASISRMELKFSPNNFKLVPCWSLVGPFLVPCWSLLRNPYCHDFAHEYITVQNTSILHAGV